VDHRFTYYVGRPRILIPKGPTIWHKEKENGEREKWHLEGAFNVVKINENLFRGYVANATTYLLEGDSLQNMKPVNQPPNHVIGGKSVSSSQFYCSKDNVTATEWQTRSRDCGTWLRYTEKYKDYIRGWAHVETNCCYSNKGQTYASVAYVESRDDGKTFDYVEPNRNWPFFPQSLFGPTPENFDEEYKGKFRGLEQISLVNAEGYLWAYMSVRPGRRTVFRVLNDDKAKDRAHWEKWLGDSWQDINKNDIQDQFSDYGSGNHGIYPGYDVENEQFILVGFPLYNPLGGKGILLSTSDDGVDFGTLDAPLVPKDPNTRTNPDTGELIPNHFENFRSASVVSKDGGNRYKDNTFFLYYTYQEPGDEKNQRSFVYREIRQVLRNSIQEPTVKLALSRYEKKDGRDSWTTTTVPDYQVDTDYQVNPDYRFVNDIGYILTKEKEGSIPLYDCVNKNSKKHVNRTSNCEAQEKKIRTLGYIYPNDTDETQGLIGLYLCYDNTKNIYLIRTEAICNGIQIKKEEKRHLGYIFELKRWNPTGQN